MQPIDKNLPRFDGNLTACILWCDGQALSTTSVTRDMLLKVKYNAVEFKNELLEYVKGRQTPK